MKATEPLLLLAVVLVLAVNTRGQDCKLEPIQDCLRPLEGDVFTISHGILLHIKQWDQATIGTACNSSVVQAKECLQGMMTSCGRIFFFGGLLAGLIHMYIDFMHHICTAQGLQGITEHGACLNKPSVLNGTENCLLHLQDLQPNRKYRHIEDLISLDLAQTFVGYGIGYFCGVLVDVRVCSARNVDRHCPMGAVNFIDTVFQNSINFVNRLVTCHFDVPLETYCIPNPCFNQGVCNYTDPDRHTCDCPPGVFGQLCENVTADAIGICQSSSCQNGGSCHSRGTIVYCECPARFTGDQCQEEVQNPTVDTPSAVTNTTSDCGSVVCQHGAVCHTDRWGPRCACPEAYTGENCTLKVGDDGPAPDQSLTEPSTAWNMTLMIAAICGVIGVLIAVVLSITAAIFFSRNRKASVEPTSHGSLNYPAMANTQPNVYEDLDLGGGSVSMDKAYLKRVEQMKEDSWIKPEWWEKPKEYK